MNMSKKTKNICTAILILAAVILITLFDNDVIGNAYIKRVLNLAAIYAIISVSMNLVNGFTGMFSLGQAGFMAIVLLPSRYLRFLRRASLPFST